MKVDMKNLPDEKKKPAFSRNKTDSETAKGLFGRKKQDNEPEQELPDEEPVDGEDTASENDEESSEEASGESSGNIYKENFDKYKEQYSKKLKNANLLQNNKFWVAIVVVLFFVFLSVNSNSSKARNQLTVQLNRTINEYGQLQTAVTDLKAELDEQARIESVILSNEEEEIARNDAKVEGAAIATLQNKFATANAKLLEISDMYASTDDEEKLATIAGEQKAIMEEQKAIKQELQPYFSDNAKTAGSGAWYKYLATGIPGKWEFASNASFAGDTMKVLWFLYADDPEDPNNHSLLAYCTAVYHASDGLFHDVSIMTTTYADANSAKYETEEEYTPDGSDMSLEEQLRQLSEGGTGTPPADEEYVNEAIEGREGYKNSVINGEIEGEEIDENYLSGLPDDDEESEESEGSEGSEDSNEERSE